MVKIRLTPLRLVARGLPRCGMARSRGHAEYSAAPLRPGRRPRRHWLRTARLNAVGWAALAGACVVAAALSVAAASALALPSWTGALCAVTPLGAVVLADRRRWAAMESGFGWGGSVDEVTTIVAELEVQGVACHVHVQQSPPTGWDRPWEPPPGDGAVPEASLCYANRDSAAVRAVLRAHGVDLPEIPW